MKRQERFYEARMARAKGAQVASEKRELEKDISLVRPRTASPAADGGARGRLCDGRERELQLDHAVPCTRIVHLLQCCAYG